MKLKIRIMKRCSAKRIKEGKWSNVGRIRRSNGMVMARTDIHGNNVHRYGMLGCLDVNLLRGGTMREAIIISVILIFAVLLWMPKRGGKS